MRTLKKSESREALLQLKDWDADLGRHAKVLWSELSTSQNIANATVCFNLGRITDWAVQEYEKANIADRLTLPSEHLNIEGARIARFLRKSGWQGKGYVLSGTQPNIEDIARSLPGVEPVVVVAAVATTPPSLGCFTLEISLYSA